MNYMYDMAKALSNANMERDRLVAAIKKHYEARGNDRCWENDVELYRAAGLIPFDNGLPDKDTFLRNCEHYYECQKRNTDT